MPYAGVQMHLKKAAAKPGPGTTGPALRPLAVKAPISWHLQLMAETADLSMCQVIDCADILRQLDSTLCLYRLAQ